MSDYNSLKAAINANIRKNGRQEITGQVLNGILRAMVDALGAGFTFRAVASPDTDPGSTDSRVFYIATDPGTYEHMGGVEIEEGEVAILKFYDDEWHKEPTGLASQAALESLGDTLGAAIGEKMTFCELWCDGDKITRKDSQIALSFAEVKELMDDPSQFVALKYIDVFWMLPQYDDEGGAIIFTGVSLMSAQGDLWRVAINEEGQISDYSIAIENQYLKTDDLGEEQRDNFKTYPTTQAVNAALSEKQDKLVSGTNIKTINGQNITGGGNINIEGGGGSEEREPGESMGYVILSKDKTFAEQVTKAFTIYEIRDKFTLSSFTMPSNCVLKFNGGSLSGSIVGDNTSIDAAPVQIFENVTFSGVWNCEEVSSEWFGAKSIQGEGTYAGGDTLSIKAGVADLPDAAPAINNALALAVLSSGKVSLMQRYYKTETTITIPKEGTLNVPQGAVIVPYMNGDGLSVRTVDKATSTGVTETLSEHPVYLLENQYIPTDSMKAAIAMSARCCIEGGGTIFLGKSTFTIGILVNGWAYEYKDMTFSPHIHIRTIGAQKNSTASPSSIDLIGSGTPTADIGDNGQYYYDKDTAKLYLKSGDVWSLKLGGNSYGANLFNTSLRFDAPNGRRIIYPFVELWDSFGFRGVEFVTTGDGWINESIIKGSVNEKHGAYFSIFANGGGVSIHHWEDTIMQVKQTDYESNYNTRLFFASKCNEIYFARAWDLSYPALPYRTPVIFEMCTKAGNVRLGEVDANAACRVLDNNGGGGSYTGHPRMSDTQAIVPMAFENLLQYKSLMYRNILSNENIAYYANGPVSDGTFGETTNESIPKIWFDNDNTTYKRVIDASTGKYGVWFRLVAENSASEIRNVSKQAWLEIDYRPSSENGNGKVFLVIQGYNQVKYVEQLRYKANEGSWTQQMTRKVFVPINFGTLRIKPEVRIYATESIANYTLDIVNVKLWVDASDITKKRNLLSGTTANRPDAAPQGLLYYNTSVAALQIQVGTDADNAEWIDLKMPTKLSDLADDTTHRLVTDAEKSTWSGKQDAISDLANIRSGASAGATAIQPSAISDMETKTHASATYQQKGSYATSAELKAVSDKVDELYVDYSTALNLL